MRLVSCILPTYNRPQWAVQSIDFILNSGYDNIEVIAVNDGGEKFEYNDSRVKIIDLEKNSRSVSIPRNIGLSWAQGEYICHVDDDVVTLPHKFTVLAETLDNSDALLAFGQRHELYVDKMEDTLLDTYKKGQRTAPPMKLEWNPNAPMGWGVDNGQIMYRRSVYDKIDPVFSRRACDWELAKRIHAVSEEEFIGIRHPVCVYIWHDKNRSKDDETKKKRIMPRNYMGYFNPDNLPTSLPGWV